MMKLQYRQDGDVSFNFIQKDTLDKHKLKGE